jgi:hypothetical protein
MNSAVVVVVKWSRAEGAASGGTMGEYDCGKVVGNEE